VQTSFGKTVFRTKTHNPLTSASDFRTPCPTCTPFPLALAPRTPSVTTGLTILSSSVSSFVNSPRDGQCIGTRLALMVFHSYAELSPVMPANGKISALSFTPTPLSTQPGQAALLSKTLSPHLKPGWTKAHSSCIAFMGLPSTSMRGGRER
jgi:hypothetical protein